MVGTFSGVSLNVDYSIDGRIRKMNLTLSPGSKILPDETIVLSVTHLQPPAETNCTPVISVPSSAFLTAGWFEGSNSLVLSVAEVVNPGTEVSFPLAKGEMMRFKDGLVFPALQATLTNNAVHLTHMTLPAERKGSSHGGVGYQNM